MPLNSSNLSKQKCIVTGAHCQTKLFGQACYYSNMNSSKFKPRSFPETIKLLCEHKGGDWLNRNGLPSQTKVGAVAGVSQVSVGRWLSGEIEPSLTSIKKLAKAWRVTPAQVIGELPIPFIDGKDSLDPFQQEFLEMSSGLSPEVQELILKQLETYQALSKKS